MEVLALVTARGGSKSIPRKNIAPFLGRPLIAWSIDAARRATAVTRVVTTTDDAEIAEVAAVAGSEVPFLRPAELARDDTTDHPVFVHALTWLAEQQGYRPDLVVHLRPTSPLRPDGLIDQGIDEMAAHPEADSLRAVCEPANNPFKMWRIEDGWMTPLFDSGIPEAYNQPRQKLPKAYWQIGTLDLVRPRAVLELNSMSGRRILPMVLPQEWAVDIDDEVSLRHAERMCVAFGMAAP
jgi:N-acylneuraminate cytidylyltransferase